MSKVRVSVSVGVGDVLLVIFALKVGGVGTGPSILTALFLVALLTPLTVSRTTAQLLNNSQHIDTNSSQFHPGPHTIHNKSHTDLPAVMTPPCYTFPAAELTERVQLDVQGRQRKMKPSPSTTTQQTDKNTVEENGKSTSSSGGSRHQGIDLARECTLLSQMVQYSCAVMHPEMRDSPVRCWPVQRMFRRWVFFSGFMFLTSLKSTVRHFLLTTLQMPGQAWELHGGNNSMGRDRRKPKQQCEQLGK